MRYFNAKAIAVIISLAILVYIAVINMRFKPVYADLPATVDFNFDVKPILVQKCYLCHGPDPSSRKGGLRLDTGEGATQLLKSGNYAINRDHPDVSALLARIEHKDPDSKMLMTEKEIAILAKWIEQGAEWKPHWAFIQPDTGVYNQVKNVPGNPIDFFIQQQLDANNIKPAAEANKHSLIRRAAYLITGLPPTVQAIEQFIKDETADAYEKMIDRYLESKAFGERWARHWMDLARYAETRGHEFDFPIANAWRYRDYLVRAFNEDIGYDQLLKEQLAGDLLPQPRRNAVTGANESHLGTVFLAMTEGVQGPVDNCGPRISNLFRFLIMQICYSPHMKKLLIILSFFILLVNPFNACSEEDSMRGDSTDVPAWVRQAIIYQVSPYNFVKNGGLKDVTEKLPELNQLGVNTLMLQPIFKTGKGNQGYDVLDFFSIRDDFGIEQDLQQLIQQAKSFQMRVLLDFIPNHTSIDHPYAKDVITNGQQSKYYSWYQHQKDGAPYSSHYHRDSLGFIYYFWKDLVNLNYDEPSVQQMITKACTYWVEKFDIDGYRFDAVWGMNSRNPVFAAGLMATLKQLKPGIFLLAEDKATDPTVYKLGYHAAYDWTADTNWVSQWSWQRHLQPQKNYTAFNQEDPVYGKKMLREVLFNKKNQPEGLVLRFLENNDLPRFVRWHSVEKTKMAAAFLFALPGIPLLYNGQEVGCKHHPYSINTVYQRNESIKTMDSLGLFEYYQQLIALRKMYPVLNGSDLREVETEEGTAVLAFERKDDTQHFLMLSNLEGVRVRVSIPLAPSSKKQLLAEDVLTGKKIQLENKNGKLQLTIEKNSMYWLLLTPPAKGTKTVQLKYKDSGLK